MDKTTRYDELISTISSIDPNKSIILKPLIEDICFMETRLNSLRKLPQIRIHPSNAAKQQTTPAAKQYKELIQSYSNSIKILLTALYRENTSQTDELMQKLSEFSI